MTVKVRALISWSKLDSTGLFSYFHCSNLYLHIYLSAYLMNEWSVIDLQKQFSHESICWMSLNYMKACGSHKGVKKALQGKGQHAVRRTTFSLSLISLEYPGHICSQGNSALNYSFYICLSTSWTALSTF